MVDDTLVLSVVKVHVVWEVCEEEVDDVEVREERERRLEPRLDFIKPILESRRGRGEGFSGGFQGIRRGVVWRCLLRRI